MSRRLLALLLVAFAGCYATAQPTPAPKPAQQCADLDGDGYCADVDCNDNNPSVHPGAEDPPGGLDQNCDGVP